MEAGPDLVDEHLGLFPGAEVPTASGLAPVPDIDESPGRPAPNRRAPLLLADIRTLMISIGETAGAWPAGMAARREHGAVADGVRGAHRRSELVALTLEDVTLHATDGLHVRLRRSKTDHEARGTVKALPYGRDPVTCPPCAYVRWRQVVHTWDTAADSAARRAVLPVLRRQAAMTAVPGGEWRRSRCSCTAAAAPAWPARPGPAVVPDGAQDRRDRRPGDVR
jgi:hypothetical protein